MGSMFTLKHSELNKKFKQAHETNQHLDSNHQVNCNQDEQSHFREGFIMMFMGIPQAMPARLIASGPLAI